jgi:hypothetical protein
MSNDQIRTEAELLSIFRDRRREKISAQNMRDLIKSCRVDLIAYLIENSDLLNYDPGYVLISAEDGSIDTASVTVDELAYLSGTTSNIQDQIDAAASEAAAATAAIQDLDVFVWNEVPSGTLNGVNAVFTLAYTPVVGKLMLFKNGILQKVGSGNDYTISGSTISFQAGNIPGTSDVLLASYGK